MDNGQRRRGLEGGVHRRGAEGAEGGGLPGVGSLRWKTVRQCRSGRRIYHGGGWGQGRSGGLPLPVRERALLGEGAAGGWRLRWTVVRRWRPGRHGLTAKGAKGCEAEAWRKSGVSGRWPGASLGLEGGFHHEGHEEGGRPPRTSTARHRRTRGHGAPRDRAEGGAPQSHRGHREPHRKRCLRVRCRPFAPWRPSRLRAEPPFQVARSSGHLARDPSSSKHRPRCVLASLREPLPSRLRRNRAGSPATPFFPARFSAFPVVSVASTQSRGFDPDPDTDGQHKCREATGRTPLRPCGERLHRYTAVAASLSVGHQGPLPPTPPVVKYGLPLGLLTPFG